MTYLDTISYNIIVIGLSQLYTYLAMIITGHMQLFPNLLTGGTPLCCPLSQGEQVGCLYSSFISFRRRNIILIYLSTITLRSHGPMHNSGHLEYR